MTAARPVPVPDERSAPYWEAAAQHRLVLARCSRCGELSHPPDVICPRCHHPDPGFLFEEVGGGGTVRSWIVVRQSFLLGFDVPFVLVDVALDEDDGVRLIGRLLDGPDAPPARGDRVRVAFEDPAPGVAVPAFTLERIT
ncbi:MAG TPA: OB-fold domain-containing protein [Acidimicrobiales bacterium]